jgi:hypothetical protein
MNDPIRSSRRAGGHGHLDDRRYHACRGITVASAAGFAPGM